MEVAKRGVGLQLKVVIQQRGDLKQRCTGKVRLRQQGGCATTSSTYTHQLAKGIEYVLPRIGHHEDDDARGHEGSEDIGDITAI